MGAASVNDGEYDSQRCSALFERGLMGGPVRFPAPPCLSEKAAPFLRLSYALTMLVQLLVNLELVRPSSTS